MCFHLDEASRQAVDGFPITSSRVARETAADPVLQQVVRLIQQGWSSRPPGWASDPLRNYFLLRDRLSVLDEVLLLATDDTAPRVVVLSGLRREVLTLLHAGHWGVSRIKTLARRHVYWPGIDREIEHLVAACSQCASQQASPRAAFSSWPPATQAWERVHIDFAGPFLNGFWLIVIDAYSRFPYVVRCSSTTSEVAIQALAKIFSVEGLPITLVSDNGLQFILQTFQDFCRRFGIRHVCSSPFHPQSNGEAERMVRTFKTQMKKYVHEFPAEEALTFFLTAYRTTPMGERSPAELLHGRQPRTLLHLLRPGPRQSSQNGVPGFPLGMSVWARGFGRNPRWIPAVVLRRNGRRLYTLQAGNRVISCHQNQLRPRSGTHPPTSRTPASPLPAPVLVSQGTLPPLPAVTLPHCDGSQPWQPPVAPASASPSFEMPQREPAPLAGPVSQGASSPVVVPSPSSPPLGLAPPKVEQDPEFDSLSPVLSRAPVVGRRGPLRVGHFQPYSKVPARGLADPLDSGHPMDVEVIAPARRSTFRRSGSQWLHPRRRKSVVATRKIAGGAHWHSASRAVVAASRVPSTRGHTRIRTQPLPA
ncbi:uncharacterized protein K02A2.6-like [Schistocerca nitens]|uniref:uncharacterized protein K02A2.6-like n=1 Tax=Schistocerca nitens TaxID=7011 RepID=UPI00211885F0|nr:uncharacterized protein K02A2.6-like [Schistocerca nitens]